MRKGSEEINRVRHNEEDGIRCKWLHLIDYAPNNGDFLVYMLQARLPYSNVRTKITVGYMEKYSNWSLTSGML